MGNLDKTGRGSKPSAKDNYVQSIIALQRKIADMMPEDDQTAAQDYFFDQRRGWNARLLMAKRPGDFKAIDVAATIANVRREIADYRKKSPRIVAKLEKERTAEISAGRDRIAARVKRYGIPSFTSVGVYNPWQIHGMALLREREAHLRGIRQERLQALRLERKERAKALPASPAEKPKSKISNFDFDPGRDGSERFDKGPSKVFDIPPHNFWNRTPTEPLRRDVLPDLIGNVGFEYAERNGFDVDALTNAMLTAASAMIPTGIKVAASRVVDNSFVQVPRLWTFNVGVSGSGKTPAQKVAIEEHNTIEAEGKKRFEIADAEYRKAPKADREMMDKPVRERVKLPDFSTESAQLAFAQNPDGLLGYFDEAVTFFGAKGRYSSRGGGAEQVARGFWLSAYDSEPFSSMRMSRADVDCVPSLSILGGVQPTVLDELCEDAARNDGLIPRFNPVILPDKSPEPIDPDRTPQYPFTQFQALIRNMHSRMPLRMTGATLHFAPNAGDVKDEMFKWISRQVDLHGKLNPPLAAHLNKYRGMFLRFCGVFHMIDNWGDKHARPITRETAWRVYRFMTSSRYQHARLFYEMVRQNEENDHLRNAAEFILANRLDFVSARELQQGMARFRNISTRDIAHSVGTLVSLGWLHHITGKRRIDQFNWEVNPAVHRLYQERAELVRKEFKARQDDARAIVASNKQLKASDD